VAFKKMAFYQLSLPISYYYMDLLYNKINYFDNKKALPNKGELYLI